VDGGAEVLRAIEQVPGRCAVVAATMRASRRGTPSSPRRERAAAGVVQRCVLAGSAQRVLLLFSSGRSRIRSLPLERTFNRSVW
jgi:hypothetical protein